MAMTAVLCTSHLLGLLLSLLAGLPWPWCHLLLPLLWMGLAWVPPPTLRVIWALWVPWTRGLCLHSFWAYRLQGGSPL